MMNEIEEINYYLEKLFPIHRSLTGEGNRNSFKILKEIVKELEMVEIKSGENIFDWEVPPEWNVEEAFVENKVGKKIIDVKENNLHLVAYSDSFEGTCSASELKEHLHTIPSKPEWVPYRTSYYKNTWGFCTKHSLLKSKDFTEPFKVKIKIRKDNNGSLTYAEALKKGQSEKEIILSSYCCHPSMANDNISGMLVACLLFRYICSFETRYSYRLLIAPETIGTICFLKNANLKKIVGGSIFTTLGGEDKFSFKESFNSKSWLNKISTLSIEEFTNKNYIKYPFCPSGSDERQFSSPGIRIETPSFHKSKFHEYEEYHTSADNLSFVKAENLILSLNLYKKWFNYVDSYCFPKRKMMHCEYQLGKRSLYPDIGGSQKQIFPEGNKKDDNSLKDKINLNNINKKKPSIESLQWLMHLADGNHSNIDMAFKSNLSLEEINNAISALLTKSLISIK